MNENIVLNLKVIPNSSKFEILEFDEEKSFLKIKLKSRPEKGQANLELMKELKKILEKDIKIISGQNSRNKKILISKQSLQKIKKLQQSKQ
ncbi:MAG: DUF167 domain-containing protein [archaeon]|nr:DUF167 domain-containing protein [archaeon]